MHQHNSWKIKKKNQADSLSKSRSYSPRERYRFSLQATTSLSFNFSKTRSFLLLTVRLTGRCSIIRAVARLHLPAANLQLVRVGQMCSAHVAHPLLLAGAALSHIDWHPWSPRGVSLHLWTRLQITGLVLLHWNKSEIIYQDFPFIKVTGEACK